MKLLTQYQKEISLQSYQEHHFGALTLDHKDLTVRGMSYLSIEEMKQLADEAHILEIELYVIVNRFFFEPDLKGLRQLLSELALIAIDGVIVSDFGVFTLLNELGFNKAIILETDTTMTSSSDINILLQSGFDEVVLARELTIAESLQIAEKAVKPLALNIFGYQLMSTSRRQLVDAYSEQTKIELFDHTVYLMKEKTRPNSRYYLYEDTFGTHVYDATMLNGLADLPNILKNNFRHLIVDSFNMSAELLFAVGDACHQIQQGKDSQQVSQDLMSKHSNVIFARGLWDTKTSDKKVD